MYHEISRCRICGNTNLEIVVDLGNQCLTGVFPKSKDQIVPSSPLKLVKCVETGDSKSCGLLQLLHSTSLTDMFGTNYGYRSGLNKSMVAHLQDIVAKTTVLANLNQGDLIIDIGSNDGTLLGFYPRGNYELAGIDPTAGKFKQYYRDDIKMVLDFFSAKSISERYPNKKAKIISSIAMFYDLENPLEFVRETYKTLDDDGVWVFEQSYMPLMLQNNAYDTICHEHLEYYGLSQVKWLLDATGFKIIDLDFNDTNGGSFRLTVKKKEAPGKVPDIVNQTLDREKKAGLSTLEPYNAFADRVRNHRRDLRDTLEKINRSGKKVFGYGASTKGNVVLQYCGITAKEIPFIAEVNEDKYGSYTPGTYIPIIPEKEAKALKPEYFLVLPWHFKKNILEKEREYSKYGGKFIFALPEIEID